MEPREAAGPVAAGTRVGGPSRRVLRFAAAAAILGIAGIGILEWSRRGATSDARTTAHGPRVEVLAGSVSLDGDESVAGRGGATFREAGAWTCVAREGARWIVRPAMPAARTHAGLDLPTAASTRIDVSAGDVLLHVVPEGDGLDVETPHSWITVTGTVLHVAVGASGTTVGVLEGSLLVGSVDGGSIMMAPGTNARIPPLDSPRFLQDAPSLPDWLPASPAPSLALGPRGPAVPQGAPCWLRLSLRNPGPGIAAYVAPNSRDPLLSLSVEARDDGARTVLSRLTVRPVGTAPTPVDGIVLLGPGESLEFDADVAPGCPTAGLYRCTARYVVGPGAPPGAFVGSVESTPVEIEVRAK